MRNCLPQRYIVICSLTLGYMVAVGNRTVFSIIMTHVSTDHFDEKAMDNFSNCTVYGTDKDYHVPWTGEQISRLHAIYFFGSFLTQIPAGILATRYSPRRLLAAELCLTCIPSFLLPLAITTNYSLVGIIRFFQGLMEGAIHPAIFGMTSMWTINSETSKIIAIVNAGGYFSPALSMIVTGATTCYARWDVAFHIYGSFGLVLAVFYVIFLYDSPAQDPRLGDKERRLYESQSLSKTSSSEQSISIIPWRRILTSRPVLAMLVGSFCRNWMYSLLIMELPEYYRDAFYLNTAVIGVISGIPHIFTGIVSIASGFIFDFLVSQRLMGATCARKTAQTLGFGIEGVFILCLYFIGADQWYLAFILLCVAMGISGFCVSGFHANQIDLAPRYSAVLTAISRLGNIGSTLSSLFVGAIAGRNRGIDEWQLVFLISGIIHIAGVIFYDVFASGHVQSWASEEAVVIVDATKQKRSYSR